MLLLDKSVCTPDAQCNAKMCALAESLQRMYDLTYMDDPRSELESMLSSSIDAELPLALERKFWFGLPNWLPNSDARAWGRMPGPMFPSTSSH